MDTLSTISLLSTLSQEKLFRIIERLREKHHPILDPDYEGVVLCGGCHSVRPYPCEIVLVVRKPLDPTPPALEKQNLNSFWQNQLINLVLSHDPNKDNICTKCWLLDPCSTRAELYSILYEIK